MSQLADVIRDAGDLVEAVIELLESDTAKEIPNIVKGLKALPQLKEATSALGKVIDDLFNALSPLQRTLLQVDALVAVIGILPDLIAGLGQAVTASGEVLAEMGIGLDGALGASQDAAEVIGKISSVLETGAEVAEAAVSLISPSELGYLCRRLQQLSKTIKEFTKAAEDKVSEPEEKKLAA